MLKLFSAILVVIVGILGLGNLLYGTYLAITEYDKLNSSDYLLIGVTCFIVIAFYQHSKESENGKTNKTAP